MTVPRYVEESDDLIASRAKDAADYREFLRSIPQADGADRPKPECPVCGSVMLDLITHGAVWLNCRMCLSSFGPSRERLIEACLLSHKDREGM